MKVLYKKAGHQAETMEIKDTLETYQKLVGGYIQVYPLTNSISIVLNEEGKLQCLVPNIEIPCHGGYVEQIVGDIVFVSTVPHDGDFHELSEEQFKFLKEIGL